MRIQQIKYEEILVCICAGDRSCGVHEPEAGDSKGH